MTTGGKLILLAAAAAVVLLIVFYGGGAAPAAASTKQVAVATPIAAVKPATESTTLLPPVAKKSAAVSTRSTPVNEPSGTAALQAATLDRAIQMGVDVPASALPTKVYALPPARPVVVLTPQPMLLSKTTRPTRFTIRPGDTLTAIAARTLGDRHEWQQLIDANPGIDPQNLRVGGTLRIPTVVPALRRASTPQATTTVATPGRRHQVGDGDTLTSIALQYYGNSNRWSEIFEVNTVTLNGNPDWLPLDVVLVIP